MKYFVGYHANCVDGTVSAWVTIRYINSLDPDAEIIIKPMRYHAIEKELEEAEHYYFVDFSIPENLFLQLELQGAHVFIIDHHISAKEKYGGMYDTVIFDMNECGASLCWKAMFPTEPLPLFIKYVRDYDLWRYDYGDITKWFNKYMRLREELDFEDLLSTSFTRELDIGRNMQDYHNYIVTSLITNYRYVFPPNLSRLAVVNCPPAFASDVGQALANIALNDIGATYYIDKNGFYCFSLRSIGDINVARIAESFGGGGHNNAAGFVLKEKPVWLR